MPHDFIPYGRQSIDDADVAAVVEVLRSDWLTTGPNIKIFEDSVATFSGATHGVAVSSGTAAIHAAMYAAGIGPGDEVIVPSLTFAATANAAIYLGAKPVFADIRADDFLINPELVAKLVGPKTKALMAVDYAGQPCDYEALRKIAKKNGLILLADSCHSLGAERDGKRVGQLADLTTLSFHPVKHITTGEGGMVLTDNPEYAERMRIFRNHGISTDHRQRAQTGSMHYEMIDLGFNYRLTDFQCALGVSQLKKLKGWLHRRNEIAQAYFEGFRDNTHISFQKVAPETTHAYHLFVIELALEKLSIDRNQINRRLRELGIGVNVHYPPIHLHPYYRARYGYKTGMLPVTEKISDRILSLPMYPAMTNDDVKRVLGAVNTVVK